MKKVILITGASSGIGKATALQLKDKGYIVYGAARRMERLESLKDEGINTIHLDLTDDRSIVACVNEIINQEGRIDVLINNAGYGSYGAVEDVSIDEARRQFEVNLFGLARITQLVLPYMRKQKEGTVINISSMAGKIHTPYGAWYHATKFALEGFTDSLRLEIEKPFNIHVVLIEPGVVATEWGDIAADALIKTSMDGAYEKSAIKVANGLKKTYHSQGITKAEIIADVITKAVMARKPKTRYLVGNLAKFAVLMRRLLSDRMFDRVIGSSMGI